MKSKTFIPYLPSRYDSLSKTYQSLLNVESAGKFGDPRLVIPLGTDIRRADFKEAAIAVAEGIESTITAEDFIVCVGDPLLISIAIMTQHRVTGGIRALRWDKLKRAYEAIEL